MERLPNGTYRVGIRLWQLGSIALQQRGLREAAFPSMNDLYEATRENVELMVLDGTAALCVEKVYGRTSVPSDTKVGSFVPLHASSVGKVLLAFSAREVLERTIDRGLERRTPLTLVEPERLAAALTDVRRSRVAFARQEMALGVVAVASPIINRTTGEVVAALGLIARAGTSLERLAPAVHTAALGISRLLR
ncbi:IclR family transcriptional regulator [Streptomyces cinereospinus]